MDGVYFKLSYGDPSNNRQPTIRLDKNEIRGRATLRMAEEPNDKFASRSVRLNSDNGEDEDDDHDDDEIVFHFVKSELTDSVVNQ